MNIFIPIICLVSLTLAEPPVGDGYPTAGSHDHHHDGHDDHDHNSEHSRAISEEYGPPVSASRNAISNEYPSNTRNSQSPGRQNNALYRSRVSSDHGSQGHSSATNMQGYDVPKARSGNFQGSLATDSNKQGYEDTNTGSEVSQGYAPASRTLSQEYGPPDVSARTLSTEYGMPDIRSTPSQEYGVPVVAARSNLRSNSPASNHRSTQPGKAKPQSFSSSFTRSQMDTDAHGYSISRSSNDAIQDKDPKSFAKTASKNPSQTYAAPESESSSTFDATSSRSLSTSQRSPSSKNSVPNSQGYNSGSQRSGVPHQTNDESTRDLNRSQDFGMRSSTNGKIDDMSSYPPTSSRSGPSSTYLPADPATRNGMLSQQYGVPEQVNKGYDSAKTRALEDLLNQEPANYDFSYQIEDQETVSDFGHTETRHGNSAHGSYFVVLPDGTKQTVEYEADERGFKPRITMEPAAHGYDDNAQDISGRSAGPY